MQYQGTLTHDMKEKKVYCTIEDHELLAKGGYLSCPKCGGFTETLSFGKAKDKWKDEARETAPDYYLSSIAQDAFKKGYLQACRKRQEEIRDLEHEVERLKIRDELFSRLKNQIKQYYGKDGGLATLEDGHNAILMRIKDLEKTLEAKRVSINELSLALQKSEERFPCNHRRIDWDDSYGECVACRLKEYADKYDDQLGLEEKYNQMYNALNGENAKIAEYLNLPGDGRLFSEQVIERVEASLTIKRR